LTNGNPTVQPVLSYT